VLTYSTFSLQQQDWNEKRTSLNAVNIPARSNTFNFSLNLSLVTYYCLGTKTEKMFLQATRLFLETDSDPIDCETSDFCLKLS